jgi:hypothetical protein
MDWNEADAMLQGRHEDSDYRRIDVITGKRRRRNWTAKEKARIVVKSAEFASGGTRDGRVLLRRRPSKPLSRK